MIDCYMKDSYWVQGRQKSILEHSMQQIQHNSTQREPSELREANTQGGGQTCQSTYSDILKFDYLCSFVRIKKFKVKFLDLRDLSNACYEDLVGIVGIPCAKSVAEFFQANKK